jgi:hypothetical protein
MSSAKGRREGTRRDGEEEAGEEEEEDEGEEGEGEEGEGEEEEEEEGRGIERRRRRPLAARELRYWWRGLSAATKRRGERGEPWGVPPSTGKGGRTWPLRVGRTDSPSRRSCTHFTPEASTPCLSKEA